MNPRRGFILMDAIGALVIAVVLASALALAVAHQARALRTVKRSREAVAIAERALADLQTGGKPAEPDDRTRVEVTPITDAQAPEGHVWVRVSVRSGAGGAELTGLIPRKAVEGKP
jgi:hypothetical protein